MKNKKGNTPVMITGIVALFAILVLIVALSPMRTTNATGNSIFDWFSSKGTTDRAATNDETGGTNTATKPPCSVTYNSETGTCNCIVKYGDGTKNYVSNQNSCQACKSDCENTYYCGPATGCSTGTGGTKPGVSSDAPTTSGSDRTPSASTRDCTTYCAEKGQTYYTSCLAAGSDQEPCSIGEQIYTSGCLACCTDTTSGTGNPLPDSAGCIPPGQDCLTFLGGPCCSPDYCKATEVGYQDGHCTDLAPHPPDQAPIE